MLNYVQKFKIKKLIKPTLIILIILAMLFCFVMSLIKFFLKGHVTAIYYLMWAFTFWALLKEVLVL